MGWPPKKATGRVYLAQEKKVIQAAGRTGRKGLLKVVKTQIALVTSLLCDKTA